jgi:hypothetical protein
MAYIKVRKQSDGSTRYTSIVRLRNGKTIVHQEAKTFAHRSAAITWAKHRKVELENPSALARVHQGAPTLAEFPPKRSFASLRDVNLPQEDQPRGSPWPMAQQEQQGPMVALYRGKPRLSP